MRTISHAPPSTPREVESALQAKAPHTAIKTSNTWASPAFLKKRSLQLDSLFGSINDPFLDDDEWSDSRPSKRTKFGRASGQWRFVDRTPSPEKEDPVEIQVDNLDEAPNAGEDPQPDQPDPSVNAIGQEDEGRMRSTVEDEDQRLQNLVDQDSALQVVDHLSGLKSQVVDTNTDGAEVTDTVNANVYNPKGQDQTSHSLLHTDMQTHNQLSPHEEPGMSDAEINNRGVQQDARALSLQIESHITSDIPETPDAPRLLPLSSSELPIVSPIAERKLGDRGSLGSRLDEVPEVNDEPTVQDVQKRLVPNNYTNEEDGDDLERMGIDENISELAAQAYKASTAKTPLIELDAESSEAEAPEPRHSDTDRPFGPETARNDVKSSLIDELFESDGGYSVASHSLDEEDGSSVEIMAESSSDSSEEDDNVESSSVEDEDMVDIEVNNENDLQISHRQELSDESSIASSDELSSSSKTRIRHEGQISIGEAIISEPEIDIESIESTEESIRSMPSEEDEQTSNAGADSDLKAMDFVEVEDLDSDDEPAESSSPLDTEQENEIPQVLDIPNYPVSDGAASKGDDLRSDDGLIETIAKTNTKQENDVSQGLHILDRPISAAVVSKQVLHGSQPMSVPLTPGSSGIFEAIIGNRKDDGQEQDQALKPVDTSFKTHLATPDATQRACKGSSQVEGGNVPTSISGMVTPDPTQSFYIRDIPVPAQISSPPKPELLADDKNVGLLDQNRPPSVQRESLDEDNPSKIRDDISIQTEPFEFDNPPNDFTDNPKDSSPVMLDNIQSDKGSVAFSPKVADLFDEEEPSNIRDGSRKREESLKSDVYSNHFTDEPQVVSPGILEQIPAEHEPFGSDGAPKDLADSPKKATPSMPEHVQDKKDKKDKEDSPSNLEGPAEVTLADQGLDVVRKVPPTDFITSNSYYVPLSNLRQHFSKTIDVLVVVVSSTKPSRAKGGPRHMHQSVYLADPSLTTADATPIITAQIFRPNTSALPLLQPGDPILLRDFKVQPQKQRKMMLLSTGTSSWAVFGQGEDVQIRGPPVEFGPEERGFAKGLARWWSSLDTKTKEDMEASVPKKENIGRRSSEKEPAGQHRRRSSVGQQHELRSGTVYTDGEAMEPESIHELRDGTTYVDNQ